MVGAFSRAQLGIYNGVPHPTRLDTWVLQAEQILEVSGVPMNLWVPFATIQLEGEAPRWWSDPEEDPEEDSEDDPKEDLEEDPKEDPEQDN